MDQAHRTILLTEGWGGELALAKLRLKLGLTYWFGVKLANLRFICVFISELCQPDCRA